MQAKCPRKWQCKLVLQMVAFSLFADHSISPFYRDVSICIFFFDKNYSYFYYLFINCYPEFGACCYVLANSVYSTNLVCHFFNPWMTAIKRDQVAYILFQVWFQLPSVNSTLEAMKSRKTEVESAGFVERDFT